MTRYITPGGTLGVGPQDYGKLGYGADLTIRYCRDWNTPAYHAGRIRPHYPVPSIYCFTEISNRVDDRSNDLTATVMMFDLIKD